MRYLFTALLLTGCGLIDDLEEALDNTEPEPVKECATNYIELADTAHFVWCNLDPRPSPPGGG